SLQNDASGTPRRVTSERRLLMQRSNYKESREKGSSRKWLVESQLNEESDVESQNIDRVLRGDDSAFVSRGPQLFHNFKKCQKHIVARHHAQRRLTSKSLISLFQPWMLIPSMNHVICRIKNHKLNAPCVCCDREKRKA